ncbi:MAG: helix-turn-helix domain-containing protein [Thermoanaerobaculia bacterium]
MKKRSAVSRGIVSAFDAFQGDDDPFAEVDEPMSEAETVIELARAEAEIQANREILLKDSMSASEAAGLTGCSRQAIEQMRREKRLIALRAKNHQWRYPRWQFEPDAPCGVVPGLEEVLQLLHLSSAGAAFWLLKPSERIGGAPPIQLLRQHRPEPVIQLAREQGYMP